MIVLQTLFIALSVSIDCFAISALCGTLKPNLSHTDILKLAIPFGIFQGLMPVFGYLGGSALYNFIAPIDHWIAFLILSIIAFNIFKEALKPQENCICPLNSLKNIVMLAIATSIDALAIGFSYAMIKSPIIIPALIFTITAFSLTIMGAKLGKKISPKASKIFMFIASAILLFIGSRILFEHLYTLSEYKYILDFFAKC